MHGDAVIEPGGLAVDLLSASYMVDRQDREYEEARIQDLQRSPPEEEATPASVSNPVGDEPSAVKHRAESAT